MAEQSAPAAQPNRVPRRHPRTTPAYVGFGDAAIYMGVGERTVRKLLASGYLKAYKLGPRNLRFKITDLDEAMKPVNA